MVDVDQAIQPNNKASIKSSLGSPILAPKRLAKGKMVNLIYGAKRVKLTPSITNGRLRNGAKRNLITASLPWQCKAKS